MLACHRLRPSNVGTYERPGSLAGEVGVSAGSVHLVPLAVPPDEAAAMLSMSRDSFDRHVRDELRLVRRGRLVLVPLVELNRWLERSAARTLNGGRMR